MAKTRDGLKLQSLAETLEKLPGVTVREGKKHPLIAMMEGKSRRCPLATSTDARRMVVSWVRETTGYQNAKGIYQALRTGDWVYAS